MTFEYTEKEENLYMQWRQRDAASCVKDVIVRNTGLTQEEFLFPNPNPEIENLDKAVDKIKQAIKKQRLITIMGDYDCDGVTATAILYRLFTQGLNYGKISVRFPKRFSEGYGLSMKVIDEISQGLLITVDNGIAAVDEIAAAKAKGLEVVIIDHHLPNLEKGLPHADVIVDPNALPNSEFSGYCGAGLAYKVASRFPVSQQLLSDLLALAAIGTIADVMTLIGDNRNIVIDGLKAINSGKISKGLQELIEDLKICKVRESDIGFKIGPVINAAGRLYDDGAKYPFFLLGTDNYHPNLPQKLIEINERRKHLVASGLQAVELIIAESCMCGDAPIVVYAPKTILHEGIVGILAGKLAEKFKVPAFVLTDTDTPGHLKGSGRSYGGLHLKELLDKASHLLVGYGGHAGAAGITVAKENLDNLRKSLNDIVRQNGFSAEETDSLYDLEISANEFPQYIKEIEKYAPYGEGNPRIIFKIKNYQLTPRNGKFFQSMGNGTTIKLYSGNSSAIGFGLAMKYDDAGQPSILDLYGNLGINTFNNNDEIQVEILDFEKAEIHDQPNSLTNLLLQRMQGF